MDVTITIGTVTVLSIKGDVDSSTFRELIDKTNPVLEQGYKNLVLDLTQVNYVSSGGLVAFQTINAKAVGMGGKVVFCGLSKNVNRVFELSGFNTMLGVFPNLESAKASFAQK